MVEVLDLDVVPLCDAKIFPSNADKEALEVTWSECDEIKRKAVERKGKTLKEACKPLL